MCIPIIVIDRVGDLVTALLLFRAYSQQKKTVRASLLDAELPVPYILASCIPSVANSHSRFRDQHTDIQLASIRKLAVVIQPPGCAALT
jgi:hypothetical protein